MSNEGGANAPRAGVEEPLSRGILFIVSSPSGGGKGTLIRRVLATVPGIGYSVSWTTRTPRPAEQNGIHYHFVSPDEFQRMRDENGFLEWANVHGNLYGTTRNAVVSALAEGRDIVLEIDIQGASEVRRVMETTVSVFILPPSFEALRQRLSARRTESPEEFELRLRNARGEVERFDEFDYVVLNDDVQRAATQLASIVYAERARCERQQGLAHRVIATFPRAAPETD